MQLENVEDIYPLSPAQAGMLFHSIAAPGTGVYVTQISTLLQGRLDQEKFIAAWQQVIQRHASLRAAFVWDGVDEPLQVIRSKVTISWELLDWRIRPESEYQAAIAARMQTDRVASFDLTAAPLMRMTLIRLGGDSWRLLWTVHHLLLDGWSMPIVLDEVLQLYRAATAGKIAELPEVRPWRDYIAWLQARDASADEPFWRRYLSGFHARNVLQTGAAQGDPPEASVLMTEHILSADVTRRLAEVAREQRVTLSTLVHGAWALLLHHYCDARDLVFGSTVSGRPAELAGVERMVGMFINTLPVRVAIDEHGSMQEWLQALQSNLLALRSYEATHLVNIQSWSDVPRGESLFDSIVAFENYPSADGSADDGGIHTGDTQHLEQSNFPLALLAVPGECLRLILAHRLSRYSEKTAQRMLRHLQTLLAGIPEYLDQPPTAVPILDEVERRQLDAWNETEVRFPSNRLVLQLIADQARDNSGSVAVACGSDSISYTGLNALANQWAHELISHGVAPGDRVAVCISRSVMMIVGVLAALKAGAAYVPLDPGYPGDRLNGQLRDSGAKIVLTDRQSAELPYAGDVQVIIMYVDGPAQPDTDPAPEISCDAMAYVIYTSGSSGEQKGVQVTHRNLLHSTSARLHYYPQQPGVFLLLSSMSFDSSVAGIFWTLCTGGTLIISGHRMEQDLEQLTDIIAGHKVTHTLCLPSLYRVLLEYADSTRLQSLNTVIVAGESFPTDGLLDLHRQALPATALYNEYGPTEASVWCTVFDTRFHPEGQPVPIGKPIANTRILLLDSKGRRCPVGLPGEIYIGGEGVAAGYLNRDNETAASFVTLPVDSTHHERLYRSGDLGRYLPDGSIVFLGRRDGQVKIRGYRIEPEEVTAVLSRVPGVGRAMVVTLPAGNAAMTETALGHEDISRLAWHLQAMGVAASENLLNEIESLPDISSEETELTGVLP